MPRRPKSPEVVVDITQPRRLRNSGTKPMPAAPNPAGIPKGGARATSKRTTGAAKTSARGADTEVRGRRANPSTEGTNKSVSFAERPAMRPPVKTYGRSGRAQQKKVTNGTGPAQGSAATEDPSTHHESPRPPRPLPRRVTGRRSPDSDDGFNRRKVRERTRAKQATLSHASQSLPANEGSDQPQVMRDGNTDDTPAISTLSSNQLTTGNDVSAEKDVPTRDSVQSTEMDMEDDLFAQVGDYDDDEPEGSSYYRLVLPNGRGCSYYPGSSPIPGTPTKLDRLTEIRDERTGKWVPLPSGHQAPRHSSADEAEIAKISSGDLRAHSPDSDQDRESSPSGSDYSEQRRALEDTRAFKKSRGKPTSDTEEEDEEDDREFVNELLRDANEDPSMRRHPSQKSRTQLQKGKGRAIQEKEPVRDVGELADDDMEEEGGGTADTSIVQEEAEQLARKWGRKSRDILMRAGLGIKLSRRGNTFNDFKAWYASTHNVANVPLPELTSLMTASYQSMMGDLTSEERKQKVQELLGDADASSMRDSREPATRLKAYVKQFEGLATSIARSDGDIQVVGVVVYTGSDQAARQASGLFSGSAVAQTLIDRNHVRVQHVVDIVLTKFRSFLLEQELAAPHIEEVGVPSENPNDHRYNEKDREYYRRIVSTYLLIRYNHLTGLHKQSFPWKGWTGAGYHFRLRITNWPRTILPPPGNEFNALELKAPNWKILANPIMEMEKGRIAIENWSSDELQLNKHSPECAQIPLVVSNIDTVLQRVSGASEYHKEIAKEQRRQRRGKKRVVDDVMSEREIRPLPSRNTNPATLDPITANPRPHKRAREESWGPGFDGSQYRTTNPAMDFGQQLYTMPPDDESEAQYEEVQGQFDADTVSASQPRMTPLPHQFYTGNTEPLRHLHRPIGYPPSIHNISQRGLPPPSARPLNKQPHWASAHPPGHSEHMAPTYSAAHATSQQPVAGPSNQRTARQGYYREKERGLWDPNVYED